MSVDHGARFKRNQSCTAGSVSGHAQTLSNYTDTHRLIRTASMKNKPPSNRTVCGFNRPVINSNRSESDIEMVQSAVLPVQEVNSETCLNVYDKVLGDTDFRVKSNK